MSEVNRMNLCSQGSGLPRDPKPVWHAYMALQSTVDARGGGVKVSMDECKAFVQERFARPTYDIVMEHVNSLARDIIDWKREQSAKVESEKTDYERGFEAGAKAMCKEASTIIARYIGTSKADVLTERALEAVLESYKEKV